VNVGEMAVAKGEETASGWLLEMVSARIFEGDKQVLAH
jgi:hypothetical protein